MAYDFWKPPAGETDNTHRSQLRVMSDSGTTTRAPVIIFAALILVVFGLLAVMWASVRGGHLLPHILGFAVYFLAFHVYLPYRVHKDATLKGRNATFWAVIAFLLPLVGAALYFVVAVVGHDATD
ncbi:ATPase [Haloferax volcanii]|nr:ATPase [Haloferax volcanii]MBS8118689.1 ATPase [Haloferax volcanii]MBS8123703.1 ATPase [Haloferax volcanii]MBS8127572.1 ATPase [Haloferax volcanii]MBS8131437.1 ATPase [Haloferax volcanii]MDW7536040.1 ATPase [Haloferax volcanii]